jgi:hypothetical protein
MFERNGDKRDKRGAGHRWPSLPIVMVRCTACVLHHRMGEAEEEGGGRKRAGQRKIIQQPPHILQCSLCQPPIFLTTRPCQLAVYAVWCGESTLGCIGTSHSHLASTSLQVGVSNISKQLLSLQMLSARVKHNTAYNTKYRGLNSQVRIGILASKS